MSRTIQNDRLMPAQNTRQILAKNPAPNAGRTNGEEVNAMVSKRKRAWDEMSATDRAVLLEAVRLRREAAEQRRSVQAGLSRLRQLR